MKIIEVVEEHVVRGLTYEEAKELVRMFNTDASPSLPNGSEGAILSHMTEEIKPALSADEWKNPPDAYPLCAEWDGHEHKIAALALYGQSFGFTREDVQLVLEMIGTEWSAAGRDEARELTAQLKHLAARIAALLPPDEVKP